VVSLAFAALLAWYFARPIRNLGQAFASVANGQLGTRIGHSMEGRQDELADLGRGFDSMAKRLQDLVEGQQRLLHDVSHELRSPLARLQAAMDLLQQQPDRASYFIDRMERESGRMNRLIGELLTIARLDAGMLEKQEEAFDLNEVIDAIAEDAAFEAEARQCRVEVKMTQPLSIVGNPDLLHRAIENIVRNALRHSPDGGVVTISAKLGMDKRELSLVIADEGDGVPEADIQSIFEPFFRSTKADRITGYGLGMAMTRRIVEAHNGRVRAENGIQSGLVVTIELPIVNN
jgi:signal transduction histidine kinase